MTMKERIKQGITYEQEVRLVNYLKRHYKRTDEIDPGEVELKINYIQGQWYIDNNKVREVKNPIIWDHIVEVIQFYKAGFYK